MTYTMARRLRRSVPALTAAAVLAIGAAGCGDDNNSSSSSKGGGGATGTKITIKDFAYSPDPLNAKVGDTITVTNDDGTAHTLTADDNSVTTAELGGGESGTVTLKKAGTLAYHCDIHGTSMKGSIEVSA
jgi:plastocyanin